MTVFECWELDAVMLTTNAPGITFMLEIDIIFDV